MKNNLISNILKESKKNKKLISVHIYEDEDEFFCGYVMDYNDEFVIIQHFTKFGKPDGLLVQRIENIESIDTNDEYTRSYQYLIKNSHKIDKQISLKINVSNSENWQIELINQLKDKDTVIELEINNNLLVAGIISGLDDRFVNIRCIGKLGEDEGNSLYRIDDITSVHYDRMEDRKRKLLFDWRIKTKR